MEGSLIASPLAEALAREIASVALVFARLGTAAMMLPGIGETVVPARIRLAAALLLSILLAPTLPADAVGITSEPDLLAIVGEIVTGAFLGIAARLVLIAIQLTGHLVAVQSGLAMGAVFDPLESSGGTAPSALLGTAGLVMLFATDLHHDALRGLAQSFALVGPGGLVAFAELTDGLLRMADASIEVGLRLAAPVVVASLLVSAALGVANRLMPMLPVFFIIVPAQILATFALVATGTGVLLMTFAGSPESFAAALAR